MIIKALKIIASFLVALVLLFLFVVKFSTVESRYECKGTIAFNGSTRPAVVYIKLNEYR